MVAGQRLCNLLLCVKHLHADEQSPYENQQAIVCLDVVEVHFCDSSPRRGPLLRHFVFAPLGDVAVDASDMVLIQCPTAFVVEKKQQGWREHVQLYFTDRTAS